MLFSVGVFLALVLNLLQVQRNVTLFPPDVISSIFSSAWWVPPCCGTASGMWGSGCSIPRLCLLFIPSFYCLYSTSPQGVNVLLRFGPGLGDASTSVVEAVTELY